MTKLERQAVEKVVMQLLLKGYSRNQIVEELELNHGYNTSGGQQLYYQTMKKLADNNKLEMIELKAEYLEKYYDLYRKALSNGELKTALAILDSIVKLQGLSYILITLVL